MDSETPMVSYDSGATFERVCPICRRFVRADDVLTGKRNFADDYEFGPNATCGKCGRVTMGFVGWYE